MAFRWPRNGAEGVPDNVALTAGKLDHARKSPWRRPLRRLQRATLSGLADPFRPWRQDAAPRPRRRFHKHVQRRAGCFLPGPRLTPKRRDAGQANRRIQLVRIAEIDLKLLRNAQFAKDLQPGNNDLLPGLEGLDHGQSKTLECAREEDALGAVEQPLNTIVSR